MKRVLTGICATLFSAAAFATTYVPISLLSPTGSISGQFITSTGPTTAPAWTTVTLAGLGGVTATQAAAAAPVQSVAGRTGAVALTVTDVPGAAHSGANTDITSMAAPFLGAATATTATPGTSTTQVATTAFVQGTVQNAPRPYFQAYLSASQSNAGTYAKVNFNTKAFDSAGYYDNATNYRFVPLAPGKYRVTLSIVGTSSPVAAVIYFASIYKNGSAVLTNTTTAPAASPAYSTLVVSGIVSMNGTTDYIEGWASINGATASIVSGAANSFIEAYYLGP